MSTSPPRETSSTEAPRRTRMTTILMIVAAIAALLLVAVLVNIALKIEDWSRDLSTNTAATAPDHQDERQRPIASTLPPSDLAKVVAAAIEPMSHWKLEEEKLSEQGVELHLTRTTGLMRYVDDIHVTIQLTPTGSLLSARSASRIGKGDLGQNPRNLRELLAAVKQQLKQ